MDTEKMSTFNGFQSFQIFQKVFETENFEKKGKNINQKEKPKINASRFAQMVLLVYLL